MLKRLRHSSIHRTLTWLVLCVWLTLVGAMTFHCHPVRSAPATMSRHAAGFRLHTVMAAERDDDCCVCKWLCALRHTDLPSQPSMTLMRVAMPEHQSAPLPVSAVLAFSSSSRGPPATLLPARV